MLAKGLAQSRTSFRQNAGEANQDKIAEMVAQARDAAGFIETELVQVGAHLFTLLCSITLVSSTDTTGFYENYNYLLERKINTEQSIAAVVELSLFNTFL